MTKKRGRPAAKQKCVPGTYDEPSKAVEVKGREYAETLYERMSLQAEEAKLRDELIELMAKEDTVKFRVDDIYEIEIKTPDGPPKVKIRCKKLDDTDEEGGGDGVFE